MCFTGIISSEHLCDIHIIDYLCLMTKKLKVQRLNHRPSVLQAVRYGARF